MATPRVGPHLHARPSPCWIDGFHSAGSLSIRSLPCASIALPVRHQRYSKRAGRINYSHNPSAPADHRRVRH